MTTLALIVLDFHVPPPTEIETLTYQLQGRRELESEDRLSSLGGSGMRGRPNDATRAPLITVGGPALL